VAARPERPAARGPAAHALRRHRHGRPLQLRPVLPIRARQLHQLHRLLHCLLLLPPLLRLGAPARGPRNHPPTPRLKVKGLLTAILQAGEWWGAL